MKNTFSVVLILVSMIGIAIEVSTCGSNTPVKTEDCTNASIGSNLCCFIRSPGFDPIIKECVQLEKSKYHGQNQHYKQTEVKLLNVYRMDCGDVDFPKEKGQLCGNKHVYYAADCWYFSTPSKSCCSTTDETRKCLWYKKKSGNITDDDSIQNLICSSNRPKPITGTLIILFILMTIFI